MSSWVWLTNTESNYTAILRKFCMFILRDQNKTIMDQGQLFLWHKPGWFHPFPSCIRLRQLGPVRLPLGSILLTCCWRHERYKTQANPPPLELAAWISAGPALVCRAQPPKTYLSAAPYCKRGGVKWSSEAAMLPQPSFVFSPSPGPHQAFPANLQILLPKAASSFPFPQCFLSMPSGPASDQEREHVSQPTHIWRCFYSFFSPKQPLHHKGSLYHQLRLSAWRNGQAILMNSKQQILVISSNGERKRLVSRGISKAQNSISESPNPSFIFKLGLWTRTFNYNRFHKISK